MKVELLVPDAPAAAPSVPPADERAFGDALDALGSVFNRADAAENAFAGGTGTLQEAIYERSRADVSLSVAVAAASRAAQAVASVLGMQI